MIPIDSPQREICVIQIDDLQAQMDFFYDLVFKLPDRLM